jgi:hypothetical protein
MPPNARHDLNVPANQEKLRLVTRLQRLTDEACLSLP